MSFFSGIVDPAEHIRLGGYPQPFVKMLGLQVIDWLPLGPGEVRSIRFGDGSTARGEVWSELIEVESAEVLATFVDSTLSGRPAVTLNRFGAGSAQYVGTHLDASALAVSLKAAWTRAGVKPLMEVPAGVEAVRRTLVDGSLLFLMNHSDAAVEVITAGGSVRLNGGDAATDGRVRLGPRDVAILHQSEVASPV